MTARRSSMASKAALQDRDVSWAEMGYFIEAMTVAKRVLTSAAKAVWEGYSLGPRGPWLVGQIASGRISTQSDAAKYYKVGRSIIAEAVLVEPVLRERGVAAQCLRQVRIGCRKIDPQLGLLGERQAVAAELDGHPQRPEARLLEPAHLLARQHAVELARQGALGDLGEERREPLLCAVQRSGRAHVYQLGSGSSPSSA